ncbi:hypothetical protein ACA910_013915 [Epithemia clementina (nom. ined.)]
MSCFVCLGAFSLEGDASAITKTKTTTTTLETESRFSLLQPMPPPLLQESPPRVQTWSTCSMSSLSSSSSSTAAASASWSAASSLPLPAGLSATTTTSTCSIPSLLEHELQQILDQPTMVVILETDTFHSGDNDDDDDDHLEEEEDYDHLEQQQQTENDPPTEGDEQEEEEQEEEPYWSVSSFPDDKLENYKEPKNPAQSFIVLQDDDNVLVNQIHDLVLSQQQPPPQADDSSDPIPALVVDRELIQILYTVSGDSPDQAHCLALTLQHLGLYGPELKSQNDNDSYDNDNNDDIKSTTSTIQTNLTTSSTTTISLEQLLSEMGFGWDPDDEEDEDEEEEEDNYYDDWKV